ncbi:MAG: hypothetical protein MZU79_00465 [Anaerotruncus sp.]|nr:hypothetical protein [Anaerotruncus sp.]
MWGVSGGLLAGAVLAWSTAFGLVPWLRRLRRAWREGRAGRDFGRSLDYLEATAPELRPEELWALLAKALREYLEARTRIPYRALTAREAQSALPDDLPEGWPRRPPPCWARGIRSGSPGKAPEAGSPRRSGAPVRFSDPSRRRPVTSFDNPLAFLLVLAVPAWILPALPGDAQGRKPTPAP